MNANKGIGFAVALAAKCSGKAGPGPRRAKVTGAGRRYADVASVDVVVDHPLTVRGHILS
jgi:hypothetical protein